MKCADGFRFALMCALCGCFVYAVSSGIRSNLAVLIGPLASEGAFSYAQISMCAAVGQFVYGVAQIFFGMVCARSGVRRALLWGCGLMAAGLALVPLCRGELSLMLSLGILFHAGTGAASFGIVMIAVNALCGGASPSWVQGLVSAGTGVGTIVLPPAIAFTASRIGAGNTFAALGLLCAAIVPACIALAPRGAGRREASAGAGGTLSLIAMACRSRIFAASCIAFTIDGFHMGIIQTHFFSQLQEMGLSGSLSSLAYSIIGAATMAGAIACGMVLRTASAPRVLARLFIARAAIALSLALLMPSSAAALLGFSFVLGLTMDASVAPVASMVRDCMGEASFGVLFGFAYACHQVGGFLSTALGGIASGRSGIALIWGIDALACAAAVIVILASLDAAAHRRGAASAA
ncbi:MAG: MFS transporter [Succinivibrio sp.]